MDIPHISFFLAVRLIKNPSVPSRPTFATCWQPYHDQVRWIQTRPWRMVINPVSIGLPPVIIPILDRDFFPPKKPTRARLGYPPWRAGNLAE